MFKVPTPPYDPGDVLRRCLRGERPFLLDGACDADGLGRFSFAGCDPDDGVVVRRADAAMALPLLEAAQRRWTVGPVDDKPWPLAVGYLGYDLGEELVARPAGRRFSSVDDLELPVCDFARYPAIWRWDRKERRGEVLAHDAQAAEKLLQRLQRTPPPLAPIGASAPLWQISDDEYRGRVGRVLEYLRAGDAYQVNLSHRVTSRLDESGMISLYLALRQKAPAPLGMFLQTPTATLASNTPELFLRVERGGPKSLGGPGWIVETRPIKGTRGRGRDAEEDRRLATELEGSTKDAAEHLMIVDLLRNDLGVVAELGSVEVSGFQRRVELPTVHHLVSTVRARVADGVGLARMLAATFPGGSVTGAPKLRAMEIIDELEGVRRGPYCGALGWLGPGARLDLALGIRTGVWRGGELSWAVGGGIVADSDPDEELAETRVKAQALMAVVGG